MAMVGCTESQCGLPFFMHRLACWRTIGLNTQSNIQNNIQKNARVYGSLQHLVNVHIELYISK